MKAAPLTIVLARASLILMLCCNTKIALSQFVKGRVYENHTDIILDSIKIKVATGTEAVYTDKNGDFKIRAKVNDLLIVSGLGYKTDTLLLTNTRFQQIYLTPQTHLLKEVKVNANNVAPSASFGMYDPDFHNQMVAKQHDAAGNYTGGVIFRFWYWKKDEKKKQKAERVQQEDAAYRKIPQIFCRDTILKYLPLKNEEVNKFALRYSPSVEEFLSPGFNLVVYLNKCYKEYKAFPLEDSVKNPAF